jgi:hypothetical protein
MDLSPGGANTPRRPGTGEICSVIDFVFYDQTGLTAWRHAQGNFRWLRLSLERAHVTDTQIISIALIFVAAIGSIMYNNSRIGDLRTDVNGRLGDLRTAMEGRFSSVDKRIDDLRDSVNQHIDDKFNLLMERLPRMEDNLTNQLANQETRISKLEHPERS